MTLVGADTLKALPAQCQMDVMFVNATSNSGVSRRLLRELYNKNLVFTCKIRNDNIIKIYQNVSKNRVTFRYNIVSAHSVYLVGTIWYHSDVTIRAGSVEATHFRIAGVRFCPFLPVNKNKTIKIIMTTISVF